MAGERQKQNPIDLHCANIAVGVWAGLAVEFLPMTTREKWTQGVAVPGGLAVLLGGFDPLEGAIVILAGTILLAVASLIAGAEPAVWFSRFVNAGLAVFGFTALFVLSSIGGVGGPTGRSFFWMALCLPLAAGWSLSFWGRGAPRWLNWLGLLGGGWYLALPLLIAMQSRANPHIVWPALVALAAFGLVTLAGCVWRLRQPRPISGDK